MAAGDLTTLANVREYLRGDFSDPGYTVHDAALSRLITSVSNEVRQHTDQRLNVPAAAVTDRLHGDGTRRMPLSQIQVNSITSVTVAGSAIPAQPSATADGYFLDKSTVELVGYSFTEGRGNVSIVYNSGWATVPTDLEDAVIQLVVLKFRRADAPGQTSLTVGGDSVQYDNGAQFANAMAILDRYRRIAVG